MANKIHVMKKIILFIIIGIFPIILKSQQARIIDLKLRILEPLPMTKINAPANVNFKLSLLNKGPDEVHLEDSFDIYFSFANPPLLRKRIKCNQFKIAGDSVVLNIPILLDNFESNEYYSVNVSVSIFNFSNDSIRLETLSMKYDNVRSVRLPLTKTSGIITNTINSKNLLYPKPIQNELFINLNWNGLPYCAKVFNTVGQVVLLKSGFFDNKSSLNLSNLNEGIYFVRFESQNTKFTEKIIIQR